MPKSTEHEFRVVEGSFGKSVTETIVTKICIATESRKDGSI